MRKKGQVFYLWSLSKLKPETQSYFKYLLHVLRFISVNYVASKYYPGKDSGPYRKITLFSTVLFGNRVYLDKMHIHLIP